MSMVSALNVSWEMLALSQKVSVVASSVFVVAVLWFWGAGIGLAAYKQVRDASPLLNEYGGSSETSFFQVIGLETSMGVRVYPFKKKVIGFMLEGGVMQSFAQFGLSYRFIKN